LRRRRHRRRHRCRDRRRRSDVIAADRPFRSSPVLPPACLHARVGWAGIRRTSRLDATGSLYLDSGQSTAFSRNSGSRRSIRTLQGLRITAAKAIYIRFLQVKENSDQSSGLRRRSFGENLRGNKVGEPRAGMFMCVCVRACVRARA
jgi:hypothetical protein